MRLDEIHNRQHILHWHLQWCRLLARSVNACRLSGPELAEFLAAAGSVWLGAKWVASHVDSRPIIDLGLKANELCHGIARGLNYDGLKGIVSSLESKVVQRVDDIIDPEELSLDLEERLMAEFIIDFVRLSGSEMLANDLSKLFVPVDSLLHDRLAELYTTELELGKACGPLENGPWVPESHWWNFISGIDRKFYPAEISNSARTFTTPESKRAQLCVSEFCIGHIDADEWMRDYCVEGLVQYMCGFQCVRSAVSQTALWKENHGGRSILLRYDEERADYVDVLRRIWMASCHDISRECQE